MVVHCNRPEVVISKIDQPVAFLRLNDVIFSAIFETP
jgi:hypothetical protein